MSQPGIAPQPFDVLARDWIAPGARWERGPGDLPFLAVTTESCRARLTAYGAHLCEWTPAAHAPPVLFVSPRSAFAPGTAIRGGVPVCFPWFANHPTDPGKPSHGFARTRPWDVVRVTRDEGAGLVAELRLASDDRTRALWDAEFDARLTIALGSSLAMTFEVVNLGDREIAYEAALHSYFTVGDVERIAIGGLEGAAFIDKVDGMKRKVHGVAPLALTGETDRVFLDTAATCVIDDAELGRRIHVAKSGSMATVVWNPWRTRAETIADVGADVWRRFVCVETANCGVHAIRLAPGARHTMAARVHVTG